MWERVSDPQVAARLNVATSFVDLTDLADVSSHIRPNTKMVWLESPTNPLLRVFDIKAICDLVHKANKDTIVVVDNTFLTSYFQVTALLCRVVLCRVVSCRVMSWLCQDGAQG